MLLRMRGLLPTLVLALAIPLACTPNRSQANPRPELQLIERVLNADPNDRLPMLIALHGLGDTPEQFLELFQDLDLRIRVIAVRAPDPYSVGTSWFPIDDPKRAPAAIVERAAQLAELSDQLARTRPTVGRPLITGFSQGGILSFAAAACRAEHYQGALSIAGALPESLPRYRKARKDFVVTAFHGRDDVRIPFPSAERTVARLRAAGTTARVTGYAGVAHTISPAMYEAYAAALRGALAAPR